MRKTFKIVDELSQKLHDGGKIFKDAKSKYEYVVLVPSGIRWLISWNPMKKYEVEADKWKQETLGIINHYWPNSVYSHQFENPYQEINLKNEDSYYTQYLKLFQNQIVELEKIIYAIKQDVVRDVKQTNDSNIDISLYTLTYDQHTHEVKLNGLPYAKPHFNSENEQFIQYVINRPKKTHQVSEIENALRIKFSKPPSKILTELGFKGAIRNIFFTDITKNTIKLINPITEQYAREHNFPRLKVS